MRTVLRAGGIALAATSLLFTTAVSAQAAPAAPGVTVSVEPLVFEPGSEFGHTGRLQVTVHNNSDQIYLGGVHITEPFVASYETALVDGSDMPCGVRTLDDGRREMGCPIGWDGVLPGTSKDFEVLFESVAKPKPFARIADQTGEINVDGAAVTFPALFRSTDGSLDDPRPYAPGTVDNLTVSAGDVTLTRQPDGSFEGRVPVSVHNNSDVPNDGVTLDGAFPAGIESWPMLEPDGSCFSGSGLPVPPGGAGWQCQASYSPLAEDQSIEFTWVLRAPADIRPGVLGVALTEAALNYNGAPQTDGANRASFTVTAAG